MRAEESSDEFLAGCVLDDSVVVGGPEDGEEDLTPELGDHDAGA